MDHVMMLHKNQQTILLLFQVYFQQNTHRYLHQIYQVIHHRYPHQIFRVNHRRYHHLSFQVHLQHHFIVPISNQNKNVGDTNYVHGNNQNVFLKHPIQQDSQQDSQHNLHKIQQTILLLFQVYPHQQFHPFHHQQLHP
jgi:hypothetical protein